MKLLLKSVAQCVGSAVGLAAAGAVVLVVGTPKGRKALRSLAVSTVAVGFHVADAVRQVVGDTRKGLAEIVQEADARRRVHRVAPSEAGETVDTQVVFS